MFLKDNKYFIFDIYIYKFYFAEYIFKRKLLIVDFVKF